MTLANRRRWTWPRRRRGIPGRRSSAATPAGNESWGSAPCATCSRRHRGGRVQPHGRLRGDGGARTGRWEVPLRQRRAGPKLRLAARRGARGRHRRGRAPTHPRREPSSTPGALLNEAAWRKLIVQIALKWPGQPPRGTAQDVTRERRDLGRDRDARRRGRPRTLDLRGRPRTAPFGDSHADLLRRSAPPEAQGIRLDRRASPRQSPGERSANPSLVRMSTESSLRRCERGRGPRVVIGPRPPLAPLRPGRRRRRRRAPDPEVQSSPPPERPTWHGPSGPGKSTRPLPPR